ncbi:MAG TPA: AAA family ATPase [Thermoguttaceae bacterium]|nr:AAA family ATPase [Thermoguttaceae bacterium]
MYESYWKLREKPFEPGTDRDFYYPAQTHQAATLKLRYAIENHRAAALLVGASGLGKTLVAGMIRAALDESYRPFVQISFPQMPVDQLVAYVAASLIGGDVNEPAGNLWRDVDRIGRFLTDNANRGRHAVVVIDEAHLLTDHESLEAIRLLSNFETGGVPGMTLILSAQVGLLPVLDRTPQLEERLAVKCLLRPLTRAETGEYVEHRLRQAGTARMLFDADATTALWQLTGGNPRRINRLCDLALLIGYAEQQQTITGRQLEAISEELLAVAPE